MPQCLIDRMRLPEWCSHHALHTGLTLVHSVNVIALMGSQWGDDADRSWLHTLGTAAVAPDGQLLLFGPYGQMVCLRLVKVGLLLTC